MTKRYEFTTSLSIHECITQLERHADPERPWVNVLSPKMFRRTIHGQSFRVSRKKLVRDSFSPIFCGDFYTGNHGTCISGEFRNVYDVRLLFGATLVIGSMLCLFYWSLQPVLYLVSIWLILAITALSGEPDTEAIVSFLKNTFHAQEQPPLQPATNVSRRAP
jgi:hypothetical protein